MKDLDEKKDYGTKLNMTIEDLIEEWEKQNDQEYGYEIDEITIKVKTPFFHKTGSFMGKLGLAINYDSAFLITYDLVRFYYSYVDPLFLDGGTVKEVYTDQEAGELQQRKKN